MLHTVANNKMLSIISAGLFLAGLFGLAQAPGAAAAGLTRTHSSGGVTVKVTYLNPGALNGPRFRVLLETHSVNLDGYNLKDLSLLRDSNGKSYLPVKVENKGGGHHRTVTLHFPELSDRSKFLDLVIQNVTGIAERVFRWDL